MSSTEPSPVMERFRSDAPETRGPAFGAPSKSCFKALTRSQCRGFFRLHAVSERKRR